MKQNLRQLSCRRNQNPLLGSLIKQKNNKDGILKKINLGMFKQSKCWFRSMEKSY